MQALYGLKSSGAAWRAHFAADVRDMGFESSLADPDHVWMRAALKSNGFEYYEYIKYLERIMQVNLLWERSQDLTRYPTSAPSQ